MTQSSNLMEVPKEFLELFKAGKEAARRGDNDKAHELFRKAAELDPYHEQVWLWLASVVETDEDRRVCFENVLELNSSNAVARRQLIRLDQKAAAEALSVPKKKRRRWLRQVFLVIFSFAFLLTVAVVTSLVLGLI